MVYIIHNDRYVAAVTDSMKQLCEWIRKCEIPGDLRITSVAYGFPFIAFECNEKIKGFVLPNEKFTFFPGDYPQKAPEGFDHYKKAAKRHTIFIFDKPWQGEPDWSDAMGLLHHEHFGEDE